MRIRPQAKTRPSPARDRVSAYATYSTSFKSVGVNLGDLALTAEELQDPALVRRIARVRPEEVRHIELGVKTSPVAQLGREPDAV